MHSIRRILIFSTISFALSIQSLFAQVQDKEQSAAYMEQAQLMMDAGSLALEEIRDVMVQAADYDTTSTKANFEAGHLYLETNAGELATKFFMRVARREPNYKYDLDYWIGNSYQDGSNFDKAIEFYSKYRAKAGRGGVPQSAMSAAETDRRIEECKNGKEFVASPKNYVIVNVGKEINSEYEDYAPVLNEAETELIFTTRRKDGNSNENVYSDNKPWEEIFIASKQGDKWAKAKNIGAPVTTPTHESTLALSSDGNTLLIYKDDGAGDIFETKRQPDGTWSTPESIAQINSGFGEFSASLSPDGKTMYFASDRPGGLGGLDIYVTTKDSRGQWGKVKNLGSSINTPFDEQGPFIDYQGKTLYFSSKGRKGMGGYDIFKANLVDAAAGKWSEPENVGYPINSPDDDVFYVGTKDGLRGYYSSVREDGLGYSDIYRIQLPNDANSKPAPIPSRLDLRVFDAASKALTDAKVSLVSVKENTPIAMTSTRAGAYDFAITDQEAKDYRLSIEKDGYTPQSMTINLEGASEQPKSVTRTIELKKIETAEKPVETAKKETIPLKFSVRVVDAASKSPLDAKVSLTSVKSKSAVAMTSAMPGVYDFTISDKEAKDYRLSIEKEGYVFQNTNLNIAGASEQAKTITRTVELKKPAVGHTQVLHNIYFDYNKATFKKESYEELSKLEAMMKQNENVRVEIAGHTDSWGPDAYNLKLSQARASAVKNYLTSKGVNVKRVSAVGYGDKRPLASNDDEIGGREVNRRVEFKIIGN